MKDFGQTTFCFLGRSGAGKDTQAKLLQNFLEKKNHRVVDISTGDQGRALQQTNSIVGRYIKNILDRGGLFADWLAISLWMCIFQNKLFNDEVIIFPSSPRYLKEAEVMDELMAGSGRPRPIPIYLDIHNEEATKRLLNRGRADDTHKVIAERLSWFEPQILPIVQYYGKRVIIVDGAGNEQEIHQRIMDAVDKYDSP